MRSILVLVGALLVTACASQEKVLEPSPEAMHEQRIALETLVHSSQPPPEKGTSWWIKMRFEQGHTRAPMSYFHLMNTQTGLQIGVVLENNQLLALLEPETAEHLSDCLTSFNARGGHWSHDGLLPYRRWAVSHDTSGNVEALASRHDYKPPQERSVVSEAITVVAYAPYFILALPVMAVDALTGGANIVPPSESRPLPLPDIRSIKPGDEFPEMVAEAADSFEYEGDLLMYHFDAEGTTVGVENGVAVTVEMPSQAELERRQRDFSLLYERDDCAALMSHPAENRN